MKLHCRLTRNTWARGTGPRLHAGELLLERGLSPEPLFPALPAPSAASHTRAFPRCFTRLRVRSEISSLGLLFTAEGSFHELPSLREDRVRPVRLGRSRFPAVGQAWGSDSVTQRVAPGHIVTETPSHAEGVSRGVTVGTERRR